ncbi:hypothetical protein KR038_010538 [Drosophila bunnanda]|nr:hypothetical protein KR038_010538 [Drosophila bunnanda]
MVQNSTATNSSLMDLSKLERQPSGERRRQEDPQNLNTLLQDILCFFILLSLGLLIMASIFCVALNIHQTATHQHGQHDKSENLSRMMPGDGPTKQDRMCFQRGPIWIRFFRCQKQHPQPEQDVKLEQLREPEQDLVQDQGEPVMLKEQDKPQPHFAAIPSSKKSDPEPQPFLVDNF